jgi:hypothetical protein
MAFRRWGFRFAEFPRIEGSEADNSDDRENCDDIGYAQVFIQAVPEIVGDKVLSVLSMTQTGCADDYRIRSASSWERTPGIGQGFPWATGDGRNTRSRSISATSDPRRWY